MILVAIQGREASFHFMAARKYFGEDIATVSCETFGDVLARLKACDYGVMAVENSISGIVHEVNKPDALVRQLIEDAGVEAIGEVTLPIEQCLITLPGASLENITAVHSHDAALKQCSNFLDEHLPHARRVEHEDTAGAAADIKLWNDPRKAAIASKAAAELHGLHASHVNIGNHKKSATRFLIVRTNSLL